jgi:hypothetical protein
MQGELLMADYTAPIADLNAAAEICQQHRLGPVNGVQPEYPRWPEAWAACEVVWRDYLDMQTMVGVNDEDDRQTVQREAGRIERRDRVVRKVK